MRIASSVLVGQSLGGACPSRERDDTTEKSKGGNEHHVAKKSSIITYLKALADLLHKHIPISREAIHGQDSSVRSRWRIGRLVNMSR